MLMNKCLSASLLARRYGPKRTRRDYERISNRFESSFNHHRSVGAWNRRSTSEFGDQLRFAEQSGKLHSSVRSSTETSRQREECLRSGFRIGRGGRFGRKGVAINFVTDDDRRTLRDIEKFYNTKVEEMPMNVADLI